MTEDEARTRWCPFARTSEGQGDRSATVNREPGAHGVPDTDCMCIACGCMAWRWFEAGLVGETPRGFCGLAGRPS